MSEELGSINKPEAGDILQKTKAYIVTLVQAQPGAPDGFEEKYNKYWEAIEVHLSQIESKAGVVNKIFCEGIVGKGDDAKLMLEQSNPGAHNIVSRRISSGANFEEFEVLYVCENGKDFQDKINSKGVPDIVLLDISMPVMDGFETAKWIKETHKGILIMALSMQDDESSLIKMIKNVMKL